MVRNWRVDSTARLDYDMSRFHELASRIVKLEGVLETSLEQYDTGILTGVNLMVLQNTIVSAAEEKAGIIADLKAILPAEAKQAGELVKRIHADKAK